VLLSKVPARFTDEARRRGIQGAVLLSLAVDEGGMVQDIHVERSLEPGLDKEAIKAVRQWQFRPGQRHGRPMRVKVQVEIKFSLDQ
jgi:protein TonB